MTFEFSSDFVRSLSRGGAVIIAGSDSDDKASEGKPSHVEMIANGLILYRVPFDIRVCSAHKQSSRLLEIVRALDAIEAPLAVIAVAGGTDALSGTLSYSLKHPVISCPPDGLDNRSVLTNPPGSSNVTIYDPKNAARFVAQMYAHLNPDARKELEREARDKDDGLRKADASVSEKYSSLQSAFRGGD